MLLCPLPPERATISQSTGPGLPPSPIHAHSLTLEPWLPYMYPQFRPGYSCCFVFACGLGTGVTAAVGLPEPWTSGALSLCKCLYSRPWLCDCSKSAHASDTNITTTARVLQADQELRYILGHNIPRGRKRNRSSQKPLL